jgi:hypothetical protein
MTRLTVLFNAAMLGALGSLACSATTYGRAYAPLPPAPPVLLVPAYADGPAPIRHHAPRESHVTVVRNGDEHGIHVPPRARDHRAERGRPGPNRGRAAGSLPPRPEPIHSARHTRAAQPERRHPDQAPAASDEARRAQAERASHGVRQAHDRDQQHPTRAERTPRRTHQDDTRAAREAARVHARSADRMARQESRPEPRPR